MMISRLRILLRLPRHYAYITPLYAAAAAIAMPHDIAAIITDITPITIDAAITIFFLILRRCRCRLLPLFSSLFSLRFRRRRRRCRAAIL